jgi:putative oxidoreductase
MATLVVWQRQRFMPAAPGIETLARRGDASLLGRRSRMYDPDTFESDTPGKGRAATLLLGRVIFGGFFLYNAWNHWQNRQMMTGYALSKGIPAPEVAVVGSGAMLAVGGLSVLLGVKPKVGAALIGAFLAGVTPTMHAFWRDEDPQEKMNDRINFGKNLALLGGASLAAAVPEPWPMSLGGAAGKPMAT